MNAKKWITTKAGEMGATALSKHLGICRQGVYDLRSTAAVPGFKIANLIAQAMIKDGHDTDKYKVRMDFQRAAEVLLRAQDAALDRLSAIDDNGPAHNADGSTT